MIQASELRIGNLIMHDGQIFPVTGIHKLSDEVLTRVYVGELWYTLHTDISPIPLTHDILKGWCGFKSHKICEGLYEYSFGTNPHTLDWLIELVKDEDNDYFYYQNGHFRLYHLHHLQNLVFAILGTGTELEVKLPSPLHEQNK